MRESPENGAEHAPERDLESVSENSTYGPEDGGDAAGAGDNGPGVRAMFVRFWPYLRAERWWLALSAVLLVLAAVMDTAAIWMFMLLTDNALATGDLHAFWAPGLAWLGIAAVGAVASFCGAYFSARSAERFLYRLRTDVFAHVQTLSPDFVARRKIGDLVARLSGDVEAVERLVGSGMLSTLTSLLSIAVYAGAALYVRWELALLAFGLAPVFWLVARRFARGIRTASQAERRGNGALSAVVEEGLSNISVVQSCNQEAGQERKLAVEGGRWFCAKLAEARLSSLYAPLVTVVETLCLLLVIGAGAWEIATHRITIGGLMGFAAYIGYLYPPLQSLGQITMVLTAARAGSERLIELLDAEPEVIDSFHPVRLPEGTTRQIAFENVGFGYSQREGPVLDGFDLRVDAGEFLMLTGASGAGKSTLTKLLVRFHDPDRGRITVDGVAMSDLELRTVRETVSLVPQESPVLHATLAENIAFGAPNATREDIVAAAREADADQFARELPDGYETMLGERGALLSGGQRRRIAVARAVLRGAPVLVLDEPTSGLDAESAERVLEPLRRLVRTRTIILISHDVSLSRLADRVVVLDAGRVLEQGTHGQLAAFGGHYAGLLRHRGKAPRLSFAGQLPLPRS